MRRREPGKSEKVPYETAEERDQALERGYRVSPVVEALCDGYVPSVWSAVVHHTVELAQLVVEEEGASGPVGARVEAFAQRHFGRQLEPALRGILRFAVAKNTTSTPMRPFASWPEQSKWEAAAASVSLEGPALEVCERIGTAAGYKPPRRRGVRTMPPMGPNVERKANALRAHAIEVAEERAR